MSDVQAILAILLFALLSLRPLTSDARSWTDYRETARRAGWAGCLAGALRVALVAGLLVLNDACRMIPPFIAFVRVVLGALANAVLYARRPAVGGTA